MLKADTVSFRKMFPWLERSLGRGGMLLVVALLLSVLLRVPYYQHHFTFIDEAWWAAGARVLLDGGRLYSDLWLDKQPLVFWFSAAMMRILGGGMQALHLGSLLLVFVICVLLFRVGSSFFTRTVGGTAAVLYALASTTYYTPRIIGLNTETLLVVFTISAMYFFLHATVHERPGLLFAAGLLSFLGVATKPVAATQIVLFSALVILSRDISGTARAKHLGFLWGGWLCGVAGLLAHFMLHGNLASWWDQNILYPFFYVHSVSGSRFLRNMLRSPAAFVLIYAWLLIPIWFGRSVSTGSRAASRAIAWWVLSAAIGVAAGRRFYANYYIQVLPPLSLLGAIGVPYLWQHRHESRLRAASLIAIAAFVVSFLWFHVQTLAHWYYFVAPAAHEKVEFWGMCRENRELRHIGEILRSRTAPNDRIFIWGSRAELFVLSGRRPATAHVDYDVVEDVPLRASTREKMMKTVETLRRARPRYLVDVHPRARMASYNHFAELLERDYVYEGSVHRARLYRLRDGSAVPDQAWGYLPK